MNVGLFFGSFNPIHIGHLIIAEQFLNTQWVDEVWFVVSPHNPHKRKQSLLNGFDRLHLVNLAIENHPKFKSESLELYLPTPSYTIFSLTHLTEKHPEKKFSVLMGEDNLKDFHRWKNVDQIVKYHTILVFPRSGTEKTIWHQHPSVQIAQFPYLDVSSSYIRAQIRLGLSVRYLLSDSVREYIDEMNWYRSCE